MLEPRADQGEREEKYAQDRVLQEQEQLAISEWKSQLRTDQGEWEDKVAEYRVSQASFPSRMAHLREESLGSKCASIDQGEREEKLFFAQGVAGQMTKDQPFAAVD